MPPLTSGGLAMRDPIGIDSGLAVYAEGNGKPVLLLPAPHACTLAPEIDKPLARLLIDEGFRVVTFDPPGAFRSTRMPTVGMAEMLACAEEALAIADIATPVAVCGHSMASVCALGLALERPDLVECLILVGTTTGPAAALRYGGMPRCWPWWTRDFWSFIGRGALLALGLGNLATQKKLCAQTIMASYVNKSLVPDLPIAGDDHRSPPSPRASWAPKIRTLDYEPRLAEIHVPVVICAGRHDPQTTPMANEQVAARIPGARIAYFERSGHYPFIEQPDEFRTVIASFLLPAQSRAG